MILIGSSFAIAYLMSETPLTTSKEVILVDASVSGAVKTLADAEAIDHPALFYVMTAMYGWMSGRTCIIGDITLEPKISHARIMKMLYSGQSAVTVNVVIPEGSNLRNIASILKRRLSVDSARFMKVCLNDSVCTSFGVKKGSMEGYCMPDTYNMYKKQKPEDIIKKLAIVHSLFWKKQCSDLLKQSSFDKHEILTLASIIEAEASIPSERARISGVYHNRLKRGMKLEADPTVQYALGKKKRLFFSDLRIDNPYNTYRFSGLPPGPINCPGRESILAALQPERHGYIFFVAKGDGSGEHVFSSNGSDHAKAVNAYRKQRKL